MNVNSLLPKIEEIRFIAKKSKATVIAITETKLDGTIFDAEFYIECYSIVRCDRDRKGGGVACYIKNDICFSTKNIFSKKIGVFFCTPTAKTCNLSIKLASFPDKCKAAKIKSL